MSDAGKKVWNATEDELQQAMTEGIPKLGSMLNHTATNFINDAAKMTGGNSSQMIKLLYMLEGKVARYGQIVVNQVQEGACSSGNCFYRL